MRITWERALADRARRQFLTADGASDAADVVERLGAVVASSPTAELAVGLRRTDPASDGLAEALAAGRLVKVYAFRGAVHVMTPATAAVHLALRASTRMWERASWQDHYGLAPSDWPDFRAAVRAVLTGPRTRDELAGALRAEPRFAHLAPFVVDGSDTLLKPLMWQGDMSFGPGRGRNATFQRLDGAPGWPGLPEVDDAGRGAVVAYLHAYGPTTAGHLRYWLGEGLGVRRTWIARWLAEVDDRVAEVDVEGEPHLVLAEDVDGLHAAVGPRGTTTWDLLPGYDQWVMGPGTADTHVVPAALRAEVSRGAHLVLGDGVVRGTWRLAGDRIEVAGSDEDGVVPGTEDLAGAVARVGQALGRTLRLAGAPSGRDPGPAG